MSPHFARHKRTTLALATAVAAGALLSTALGAGSATASPALPGAPLLLSDTARTALIQEQQAGAAGTAREIGLGAKEKLVVKDVVKDRDGTVHTRYERTYDGLPVLGGDLVVHRSESGAAEGVTRATKAAVKVATVTPKVDAAKAERQALSAAKDAGSSKTAADSAPRKVIWAATGKPVLAYETVSRPASPRRPRCGCRRR
ncbi:M4 family metallopeptidase, partial [Streptomyces sp. NPDC005047]